MDHAREGILIFHFNRDTVSATTGGNQLFHQHILHGRRLDDLFQLAVKFGVGAGYLSANGLQSAGCIICKFILGKNASSDFTGNIGERCDEGKLLGKSIRGSGATAIFLNRRSCI